ncbi:MAG TPA: cbb3-type cytochrome c oxidase subunit I, partial [Niabella sp.]|nr:cbb3-type cytochrome c oxidase subunit I [Niabella sp.]
MEIFFDGLIVFSLAVIIFLAIWINKRVKGILKDMQNSKKDFDKEAYKNQISNMSRQQLSSLLDVLKNRKLSVLKIVILSTLFSGISNYASAQNSGSGALLSETGIIITIALLLIPIILVMALFAIRMRKLTRNYAAKNDLTRAKKFAEYLKNQPEEEIERDITGRQQSLDYSLTHKELSGNLPAQDTKGILNVKPDMGLPFVAIKKKAITRKPVDPQLSKLVLWYLICATFWLLFGTTIGEYVGIKFVAPDADHLSWLSFGRLRPVHTNSVFWGWASLGMLGLGYYVVPRVGNRPLYSYKLGWYSLYLINATVLLGSLALMDGINNGGGEYREYIWPIMLLFGIGLVLTLINFLKTIARRATKEIYISNWYIVSAIMFCLVIATVAYVPSWQNGLGETIV